MWFIARFVLRSGYKIRLLVKKILLLPFQSLVKGRVTATLLLV